MAPQGHLVKWPSADASRDSVPCRRFDSGARAEFANGHSSVPGPSQTCASVESSILLRNVYYELKPFLPWRLRLGLRRMRARWLRRRFRHELADQ